MFKNYFKIALRNLVKHKVYSLINIFGLSVGLASCILILLHVTDEYSYDNFHEKGDRIYRMALERKYPDHSINYAIVPHSFADVMHDDFPEIEAITRVGGNNANATTVFRYDDNGEMKIFEETGFLLADSNFFKVFDFPLIKGNIDEALLKPNSMVITASSAQKYFGDDDPLQKVISTDFGDFTITGVCEDVPQNSHLKFDFIGSWNTFPFAQNINYIAFSMAIYTVLHEGASPEELEAKFPQMVETYAASQIEQRLGVSFKDYTAAGNGYNYFLQPLRDIHLKSHLEAEFEPNGNITYVYIFISIAVFILVIACINFMNLATSRSSERAKEVGVRKVMGSERRQLISQFLIESILISTISLILALVIIQLALPSFNNLANKELSFNLFANATIVPALLIFTLVVGLLAGSYPAFVLSGFNPVTVMKGKLISSAKGAWLRNGLVVFQFFISIVLIAGSLLIYSQMEFIRNKSLGYNKDHVLVIQRPGALAESGDAFDKEVMNLPNIKKVGRASTMPGAASAFFFGIQFQPEGSSEVLTTKGMVMDDHFAETINFEMIDGRSFSEDFEDSLSIILNESAVKALGVKDPIGAKLVNTNNFGGQQQVITYTIIGIVKDFNFQSLRDEISPLVIMHPGENTPVNFGFIAVKVGPQDIEQTLAAIEDKWNQIAPEEPFKYTFFDEDLAANYRSEQNSGKIFGIFTVLAIVIACIGLFGLAAYTAQQRTKEIGVRKALGASVFNVVLLLSKEFTKLILIALVIAIPLAWYGADKWLQSFAYRVDINITIFIIAGLSAIIISWLTVSYHAFKAAMVNPIKSLKYE
ncbi:ABC transporter permease [Fulvivirgaceae bacterium BMA10]|uniref:ABC transporter permease n=1 Tax=Splendidivirga corallicola TaxID=3051826 RepID=A0ABT8KIT6_9BACT|nr:ABC transporter permease [Fulvivirgaceae bacterium BMA10]